MQPSWQPSHSTPVDINRHPANGVPRHRPKSTPVDTPRVTTGQLLASSESEFKAIACSVSVRTVLTAKLAAQRQQHLMRASRTAAQYAAATR